MTPERLRLAAEHLRITAQCLCESYTFNGQWDGKHPDEKADCEEMQALSVELDAHAVHEEEIWRMATAPRKPQTRADKERGASMFASISAKLAHEAASMPADPTYTEDESCEGYRVDPSHGTTGCLPNAKVCGPAPLSPTTQKTTVAGSVSTDLLGGAK
jgi:hypothetical protein